MKNKEIDFSDLQAEVIEHWDAINIDYCDRQLLTDDPYPIYEPTIKSKFDDILADPMACIDELGYNDIASYMADNPAPKKNRTIIVYMSSVLNRQHLIKGGIC